MSETNETHYLNADFDLSLRARAARTGNPKLQRQVDELSVMALLGAASRDHALVKVGIPDPFLEHLQRCGLEVPRLLRHPRIAASTHFRPFGWSADAIELNRLHRHPVEHPSLDSVRRVNSRSFALRLEAELVPDAPRGWVVEDVNRLIDSLAGAQAGTEVVVKAEHGNAGLANRRLGRNGLTEADIAWIRTRLEEDDRLLVEPWRRRERDWCVIFEVPFARETARIHESICTRDGSLIGAIFEPGTPPDLPHTAELREVAARVASRLQDSGYWGPVCLDAFSWREQDRLELRPIVDLNCRRSMSDGVHRLWRKTAPDRTVYFRFFNRRKLRLATNLSEALAALEPHRYDPVRRTGILLATPLEIEAGGERRRPGKIALLFFAEDRPEAFRLERWFRDRFEG